LRCGEELFDHPRMLGRRWCETLLPGRKMLLGAMEELAAVGRAQADHAAISS
jgi:hypothetical protein